MKITILKSDNTEDYTTPHVNNWNISVKTRKTVMPIIDTKTADN